MTVSSTTVKNSYSGDGSQTTFVYGYKIFADSDIKVIYDLQQEQKQLKQ